MRRKRGKRGERAPRTTIPGQIIPDKMIVSLPYYAHINPSVAASVTQIFQSSGYDPDYTGIGHQPLGYDQWTTFYQNCRVFGITGSLKVINRSDKIWTFVMLPTDDVAATTALTGSFAIQESPGSVTKVLGLSSGGHDLIKFKVGLKAAQTLGLSKMQYKADISTLGTMGNTGTGSNPVLMSFLYLYGYTVDGAIPATGITIVADLVYHCELIGRKPLAVS